MAEPTELYRKHRPTTFKQVYGQEHAVAQLKSWLSLNKVPQAILFQGPSGVGKTTLARILAQKVECSDADFRELNCALERGIDMVRDIRRSMGLSPVGGKRRIFLLDECHKLTGDAQNSLLKLLEDPPPHILFILCTTEVAKVIKTIQTRCTSIALKLMDPKSIMAAMITVCTQAEKKAPTTEVLDKIIDNCGSSGRAAIVLLNAIIDIEGEEEQIRCIEKADIKNKASELVGALLRGAPWLEVAKILKTIEDEAEGLRRYVLAAARNGLLSGGRNQSRCYAIIKAFKYNYFESGDAGLAVSCYEVCGGK